MAVVCNILHLKGRDIELVSSTAQPLICSYSSPDFKSAVIFSDADEAITSVAGVLGEAGKFINAKDSLNSITKKIEEIIPALAIFKLAKDVSFMNIVEIHPIDRTSFIIAISLSDKATLGSLKIDGIGFQIKVTKTG